MKRRIYGRYTGNARAARMELLCGMLAGADRSRLAILGRDGGKARNGGEKHEDQSV